MGLSLDMAGAVLAAVFVLLGSRDVDGVGSRDRVGVGVLDRLGVRVLDRECVRVRVGVRCVWFIFKGDGNDVDEPPRAGVGDMGRRDSVLHVT